MATTKIKWKKINELLEVAIDGEELFRKMWTKNILDCGVDTEEAFKQLELFVHYHDNLQRFIKYCSGSVALISSKDVLDVADTYNDIPTFSQEDKILNARITLFSNFLIQEQNNF